MTGMALVYLCRAGGQSNHKKGGESPNNERRATQIVIENGRVLRSPRHRVWLKKTMRDPKNSRLDAEEFVRKAIAEAWAESLEMSRGTALALFRLFRIRVSQALKDALDHYPAE